MLERIRESIDHLEWIILLILVIIADGLVGGLYRLGGKETLSRVIGVIMIVSYVASVASFLSLRGIVGFIAGVVTLVCFILDLVTVIRDKKITYFAA
ncbi:MAG: hypothetical protein J5633_07390 [Oscillospiraceae bacterium]|nr:hypothetical protein [Oscillospiraceae bacterium]